MRFRGSVSRPRSSSSFLWKERFTIEEKSATYESPHTPLSDFRKIHRREPYPCGRIYGLVTVTGKNESFYQETDPLHPSLLDTKTDVDRPHLKDRPTRFSILSTSPWNKFLMYENGNFRYYLKELIYKKVKEVLGPGKVL